MAGRLRMRSCSLRETSLWMQPETCIYPNSKGNGCEKWGWIVQFAPLVGRAWQISWRRDQLNPSSTRLPRRLDGGFGRCDLRRRFAEPTGAQNPSGRDHHQRFGKLAVDRPADFHRRGRRSIRHDLRRRPEVMACAGPVTQAGPVGLNVEPIAGDVHFNTDEGWQIGANTDVFTVASHEAGHALGLEHSDNPTAVMYADYDLVTGLTADDIRRIQSLYGVKSTTSKPSAPAVPTSRPRRNLPRRLSPLLRRSPPRLRQPHQSRPREPRTEHRHHWLSFRPGPPFSRLTNRRSQLAALPGTAQA